MTRFFPIEAVVIRIIAFEAGLGALALALGLLLGIPVAGQVRFTAQSVAVGLAATVPMVGVMFLLTELTWSAVSDLVANIRELVGSVLGSATTLQLALVALAAGAGEEMLFRGVMQTGLVAVVGPVAAVAVTSVVFGVAHAITPLYAVLAASVSVYLGWLMLAAGSIVPPIIAHAMYDWVALIYLARSH